MRIAAVVIALSGTGAAAGSDRVSPTVGRFVWVSAANAWVLEHEVTQGQWRAVMGGKPAGFDRCGETCPVERVSWHEAVTFAWRLSAAEDVPYRLPTEAEWEAAAGSSFRYAGSDDPGGVAWYGDNSGGSPHAVCGKQRNAYDLCDLSGNVWEWTLSEWGTSRVIRGGGWFDSADFVQLSSRLASGPSNRHAYLGFRLVIPFVERPAAP